MLLNKMFPSPDERAKIIARREEILGKMQPVLAGAMAGQEKATLQRVLKKLQASYPPADIAAAVKHVLSWIARNKADMGCTPAQQDANRYRYYVETYRRFGGTRRFVSQQEFNQIVSYFSDFSLRLYQQKPVARKERAHADKLADLLLSQVDLWDDITPEAPPKDLARIPRPEDIR